MVMTVDNDDLDDSKQMNNVLNLTRRGNGVSQHALTIQSGQSDVKGTTS